MPARAKNVVGANHLVSDRISVSTLMLMSIVSPDKQTSALSPLSQGIGLLGQAGWHDQITFVFVESLNLKVLSALGKNEFLLDRHGMIIVQTVIGKSNYIESRKEFILLQTPKRLF